VALRALAAGVLAITAVAAAPKSLSAGEAALCTPEERQSALAEDQRRVLQHVGSLSTLRDMVDVVSLAGRGWSVLPHMWVSFKGIGVAIARPEVLPELLTGLPSLATLPPLLIYRPSPAASNVTDPYGADFPYTLVGWAYGAAYDYRQFPTTAGRCYERRDWMVHERGIHDLATWTFVPVPPQEQWHGQEPGNEPLLPLPPGLPHPRLWSLHVWLNQDTGVPNVSMLHDEAGTIPGVDPGVGIAFFHPQPPPG
jgi:hypothetical protein